jgi:hypothetical protein
MINMHKCTLHVGKDLYLVLQLLAKVVGFPERGIGLHHDVDFHKIILTKLELSATRLCRRAQGHTGPL